MENNKLGVLQKIYNIFENEMQGMENACRRGCSTCCTASVTMTGLEASLIMDSLSMQEKKAVKQKVEECFPEKRYIPDATFNGFARLCRTRKGPPEQKDNAFEGRCPLLENDICTVYASRPLGCRAMISNRVCKENGCAIIPPLVLTMGNLFMQVVEHVDEKGLFGNLSDLMILDNKGLQEPSVHSGKKVFQVNEKISVLMVPREHRIRLKPVVEKLSGLLQQK